MFWIIRLKECRRCGGDLSVECDKYGTYASCLQCGSVAYDMAGVDWEAALAELTKAS